MSNRRFEMFHYRRLRLEGEHRRAGGSVTPAVLPQDGLPAVDQVNHIGCGCAARSTGVRPRVVTARFS